MELDLKLDNVKSITKKWAFISPMSLAITRPRTANQSRCDKLIFVLSHVIKGRRPVMMDKKIIYVVIMSIRCVTKR